ncbi:hypothetical protein QBC43DRAFT_320079 [Cladorrhinum sp. PSN259]|nr:hypothetical protein QBC43DRAFT_320079 [Cladorrhinum sp. PSN259]
MMGRVFLSLSSFSLIGVMVMLVFICMVNGSFFLLIVYFLLLGNFGILVNDGLIVTGGEVFSC